MLEQPPRSEPSRTTVTLAYVAGALQGLAVVALPASATPLRQLGLSEASYGAIFLAQTVAAIAGALGAGALARRRTTTAGNPLSALLAFALTCHAIAMVALVAATRTDPSVGALVAAVAVGLGFGVGAVPLNAVPAALAPARRGAATVAMHASVGAGFAAGPALVGAAIAVHAWSTVPMLLAVASIAVAALVVERPLPTSSPSGPAPRTQPRSLIALAVVAVAYALAEGTFSNWATVFLHDARGVDPSVAALALSGFWAAIATGRLLTSLALRRVGALLLWQLALVAMAAIALSLPRVSGAITGVLAFTLAGLATAAVFPLTVTLASERLGVRSELASSVLTAALMTGVGIGSFVVGSLRDALGFDALYRCSAIYPSFALALGSWRFMRRVPQPETSTPCNHSMSS